MSLISLQQAMDKLFYDNKKLKEKIAELENSYMESLEWKLIANPPAFDESHPLSIFENSIAYFVIGNIAPNKQISYGENVMIYTFDKPVENMTVLCVPGNNGNTGYWFPIASVKDGTLYLSQTCYGQTSPTNARCYISGMILKKF